MRASKLGRRFRNSSGASTAQRGGGVNKCRNCSRPLFVQIPRWIDLRRLDGLHSQFARLRSQMLGRAGSLALQHQPPLLLQKLRMIEAQGFAFVTILNRNEVLPRRVNETARENKPARQQERQTCERTRIALAMHGKVLSAGR